MTKSLLTTLLVLGTILSPMSAADPPAAKEGAATATKATEQPARKKPAATTGKSDAKPARPPATKASAPPSYADPALTAHAEKQSAKLTDPQSKQLLDLLNKGDAFALQSIPGIGGTKADALAKARPFRSVASLVAVEGIGGATFDGIVQWARDGMKSDLAAGKPATTAGKKTAVMPDTPSKKPVAKPAKPTPAKKSA